MTCQLYSPSLDATLEGVSLEDVWHFRGLQYGHVSERFAAPASPPKVSGLISCVEYGALCPQPSVDVRHLLRIPPEPASAAEQYDEFNCLNLDIARPAKLSSPSAKLPVLVWIYGGSQTVSFGSPRSNVCDPLPLVRHSIRMGKPIILVSLNYRLNIFAFGAGRGQRNLALADQERALLFIREHTGGFGGDPDNITLFGESAGAVYAHALCCRNAPIKQVIYSSGSLYLSPPRDGAALITQFEHALLDAGAGTLRTASVSALLDAVQSLDVQSFWLQPDPSLEGWQNHTGAAERLLIGDCEYESVLWRNGIERMDPAMIKQAFDESGNPNLSSLYQIIPERPTSCRLGALDFLNDARFVLATEDIRALWKSAGKPCFRFLVDQANPWQSSSRAHHGVDLLLLFGGSELSFNPAAERVGSAMKESWITFVNGGDPWMESAQFAFGPLGIYKEINSEELRARRRMRHIDAIKQLGPEKQAALFGKLAAGRISLLN